MGEKNRIASLKVDYLLLFFCTAILLPVFGELLYFYSVCNSSATGFAVFSFLICFNLLLQVQCLLKVQHTLPNKGALYAATLLFICLMYIVPFFSLTVLIYNSNGNSDAAVTISMLYVYAFSFVLGIIFIFVSKLYKKKKLFTFIIISYSIFVSSCILCSFYADSKDYTFIDSTPPRDTEYLDNSWNEYSSVEELSQELELFYKRLEEADVSYEVSESLSPVLNVGMLYRINSVSNIKAIVFEGLGFAEQRTKVFAYVGKPKHASEENKVPAVVLIHGAGGTASYAWVKQWTDRGYAAISVSVFGEFPDGEQAIQWDRELPREMVDIRYTVSPNIDGMSNTSQSVDIQWMYHAVGQTILANNIIRSFDWVDDNNVGLCGISWGGVVATVAMTYDERFSFSIPVFASAYLQDSGGIIEQCYSDYATNELWAAEKRLAYAKMPVLWICGNDDIFFSPTALSNSYTATVNNNKNTRLSFLNGAKHNHNYARSLKEVYAFAESVTDERMSFPYIINQPTGRSFEVQIISSNGFTTAGASLYYLTDEWSIQDGKFTGEWHTMPLSVDDNTIKSTVPENCTSYYIDIQFNNGRSVYNISSEYVTIENDK